MSVRWLPGTDSPFFPMYGKTRWCFGGWFERLGRGACGEYLKRLEQEPGTCLNSAPMRPRADLQERFNKALDQLIEKARADRSILAAVLCGSLSHDTVWEKSDV